MTPPIEDIGLLDFDRSNKGASKQRRDQINAEIATMRDLLPLPESSRQRLSQLQIMSLTCVYIRKCNVLQKLFRTKPQETRQETTLPDSLDFFQALTGFLLVTTKEGKLLYISENVTDFLGHSMVDMKTQGDSLYDIVDKRDQPAVQSQLLATHDAADDTQDVSFFCRMNMSRTLKRQSGFGDVKIMHVRGHFITVTDPGSPYDGTAVLMATCSPLITSELKETLVQNNTMVFKTVHKLDMTFLEVTNIAEHHLGYTSEELNKQSWYSMIHPEDIHEAKEKHVQLIRSNHEMGSMMTVRMLRADGSSFWVNMVMHVRQTSMPQNDEPLIVCINQVINAKEALQLKMQSHMFSLYPSRAQEMWSNQLTSVATVTDAPLGHWVQQSGSNPLTVPGYQISIPGVLATHGRPVYHQQCQSGMAVMQGSKPIVSLSQSNYSAMPNAAVSIAQSDKLKAMLKRKIQGPQPGSCRPAKISKIGWSTDGYNGGQGYGHPHRGMMEGYGHMPTMCYEGNGGSMQVMHHGNYRHGLLAVAGSPEVLSCQAYAPAPMLSKAAVIAEQVVPDVNLPDSYLTPDPSPINSPQPLSSLHIKTEVMDPEDNMTQSKNSTSILQALEKLASLKQDTSLTLVAAGQRQLKPPQSLRLAKPSTQASTKPQKTLKVKQKMTPAQQQQLQARRRDLPIFDASEIDTFFDTLDIPELDLISEMSRKMERDIKTEIKTELEEEQKLGESAQQRSDTSALSFVTSSSISAVGQRTRSPLHECVLFSSCEENTRSAIDRSPKREISNSPHSPASSMHGSPVDSPMTSVGSPMTCYMTSVDSPMTSPRRSVTSPVESSIMSTSPKSVSSEGSIHELLKCFSDDGFDLSPLQMEPSSMMMDRTQTDEEEDTLESSSEDIFLNNFYPNSSTYTTDKKHTPTIGSIGSTASTSSDTSIDETRPLAAFPSLGEAEEEIKVEERSGFTLAMALSEIGSDDDSRCSSSLKDRGDALSIQDPLEELDFLLGAF